jgi:hypothetical protein
MTTTKLQDRLTEFLQVPGLARHLAVLWLALAGLLLTGSVLWLRSDDTVAQSLGWVSLTTLLLMLDASRRGALPAGSPRHLLAFLVPAEPVPGDAPDQFRLRRRLPDVWFTWTLRQGWQMRRRNENLFSSRRRSPARAGAVQ